MRRFLDPLNGLDSRITLAANTCRELKVREAIRLIRDEGWYQVAQEGSHRQFKHPRLKGRVTIAGHMSDELPPRILRSILKQARLGLMR